MSLCPCVSEILLLTFLGVVSKRQHIMMYSGIYLMRLFVLTDFKLPGEIGGLPDVISRGGSTVRCSGLDHLAEFAYEKETIIDADIDLKSSI